MRKVLFVIIGISILGTGVYFWLQTQKKTITNPWQIISSKALCVVESDQINEIIRKVVNRNLIRTGSSEELMSRISSLKNKRKLIVACYSTSNEAVDGLVIIPGSEEDLKALKKDKDQLRNRTFSGYSISEIYNGKDVAFSYCIIDDLVAIGSSFLIEDAIRTITEKKTLFKDHYNRIFQLKTSDFDDGNIYINASEFFSSTVSGNNGLLKNFTEAALVDIKIDKEQILINGFSVDSVRSSSMLSLFKEQKPGSFGMRDVISSRSDGVIHYYLSNPSLWYSRRIEFVKAHLPSLQKEIADAERKFSIDFNSLMNDIGSELAVCYTESQSDSSNLVFVLKVKEKDIENALSKMHDSPTDQEQFDEYLITKVTEPFFIKDLLWPIAPSNKLNFYTSIDNYILFSSNRDVLKGFLSDLNSDNTLSKSLEWNKFHSSTIQESNISYFFTGSGIEQMSYGRKMKSVFNFSLIDKGSIQFSGLDRNFSMNALLHLKQHESIQTTLSSEPLLNFQNKLNRQPEIVVNHSDKSSEILLQDSTNQIHLVSGKNKVLWSLKIDSEIKGEISQIDFYKNKKLQYFFTTKDQMNVVDRLGRFVKGFPLPLKQVDITFSKVIDYNRTKDYRFMLVERKGNIYLLDKEGKALEGWNPKVFSKNIIEADLFRISSKDYFLIAQDDGVIYLYNRKGEIVKNFPVRLGTKINQCVYVANKHDSGHFSIVSEDGVLFNVNTSGEIIKKEPLLKNFIQSHFQLVIPDKEGIHWIARVDKTKIALFDQEGKLLFEKENPASEKLLFNYFHSSKPVFSIFDPAQELLILWDENGKEIMPQPIETNEIPAIEFSSEGKMKMYYVFRKQMKSIVF